MLPMCNAAPPPRPPKESTFTHYIKLLFLLIQEEWQFTQFIILAPLFPNQRYSSIPTAQPKIYLALNSREIPRNDGSVSDNAAACPANVNRHRKLHRSGVLTKSNGHSAMKRVWFIFFLGACNETSCFLRVHYCFLVNLPVGSSKSTRRSCTANQHYQWQLPLDECGRMLFTWDITSRSILWPQATCLIHC